MKKFLIAFFVLTLSYGSAVAQTQYERAYIAGVAAGLYSMSVAVPMYSSSTLVPVYLVGNPALPLHQWSAVNLYDYGLADVENKVTVYKPIVDPASANIAAYMSIVSSYNYYLMEQNAINGGDMEQGSFDGYKAGLNQVMLGLE